MTRKDDLQTRKAALEARRRDGAYAPNAVSCHFLQAWLRNADQPPLLREARPWAECLL